MQQCAGIWPVETSADDPHRYTLGTTGRNKSTPGTNLENMAVSQCVRACMCRPLSILFSVTSRFLVLSMRQCADIQRQLAGLGPATSGTYKEATGVTSPPAKKYSCIVEQLSVEATL